MERPFRMLLHLDDRRLHVKLSGCFTGKAAVFLLRFLHDHGARFNTVYLHTGGLGRVDNGAWDRFLGGLRALGRTSAKLSFTGEAFPGERRKVASNR